LFGARRNREQAPGSTTPRSRPTALLRRISPGARSNTEQAAGPATPRSRPTALLRRISPGARSNTEQAAGPATPRSRPTALLIGGAVALVALMIIGGGLTWLLSSGGTGSSPASAAVKEHHARPAKPAPPVHVLSVTPADAAYQVNGAQPVTITFSAPLAADSPTPSITPAVQGTWAAAKSGTMVFTPATAFKPDSTITVRVPAGPSGVRTAAGGLLGAPVTARFHTRSYSHLRLQELLARLGYLPLIWTPSGSNPAAGDRTAQYRAAYHAPGGTFSWEGQYPASLTSLWAKGKTNLIDVGAIRAFESVEGLPMDGVAGPKVWRDLLHAVAKRQSNPNGYSYALASKGSPETLTVWHDGQVVLHTPANTGIAAAPTADGTYPVYLRMPFQIMKGTNPDGSHYADPVRNVAYFNGGDALHFFPRASFGFPQSLGCVELPLAQSAVAYRYMTYGSLVTVTPT
jgi:peptidoglycan hydrolase-like protein with peptidoglycan-binding domain